MKRPDDQCLCTSLSVISDYANKGAVSFLFSQGLLILMCNNLKLKADISFFFFVLHRNGCKVYTGSKIYDLTAGPFL